MFRRATTTLALTAALGALAGCSMLHHSSAPTAAKPPGPHEIFDEQTAGTLTVVSKPLVFARSRSDVAAHAKDYATLVAIEEDYSGNFKQFLLLYRWSTVDKRMSPPPAADQGALRLLADARVVNLTPLAQLPVSLTKQRELLVPAHGEVVAHAYAVDAALLRFIASSRTISLRMPEEPLDTPFALYEDGRPALMQFVLHVTGP